MVTAEDGYSLFIDIGSNKGIISIQVEESFRKLIALKLNPIAFEVLQANALAHNPKYYFKYTRNKLWWTVYEEFR